MKKIRILEVIWKENVDTAIVDPAVIGIVAYRTSNDGWRAAMGITRLGWAVKECSKTELREEAETICRKGSPLTAEQAHDFFPELDITAFAP